MDESLTLTGNLFSTASNGIISFSFLKFFGAIHKTIFLVITSPLVKRAVAGLSEYDFKINDRYFYYIELYTTCLRGEIYYTQNPMFLYFN
jgi:hypothetical protein